MIAVLMCVLGVVLPFLAALATWWLLPCRGCGVRRPSAPPADPLSALLTAEVEWYADGRRIHFAHRPWEAERSEAGFWWLRTPAPYELGLRLDRLKHERAVRDGP